MEVTSITMKDGQTWFTIRSGREFVVVHIKNAEAKKIEQKGTNINVEM